MSNPKDKVSSDIKADEHPIEICNDSIVCKVCGRRDCKKVNHTPPATDEQCGITELKNLKWWNWF